MLLMRADTTVVRNVGIRKFGVFYSDSELGRWVNRKVSIKWDIDDVTKLYVYDLKGRKICEAVSAEVLSYGEHCSQAALEKLKREQAKQKRDAEGLLEDFTTPYEARLEQGRPSDAVGKLDLMIGHAPSSKIISLPTDKEYRGEVAAQSRKKRSGAGGEFLAAKGESVLDRLRAMNE